MSGSGVAEGNDAFKVQQITARLPRCSSSAGSKIGPPALVALTLQPLTMDDLNDYFTLHSDARVWEHLPSGRHTDIEKTKKMLANRVDDWRSDGLNYWSVKEKSSLSSAHGDQQGKFVGVGGAGLMSKNDSTVWNLYYRVLFDWWGCGIAAELAKRAFKAALLVRPDIPIVAFMLEHNAASKHIAEKVLQFELRWRGPDAGNPDPAAIRLVYSDRPLDEAALHVVTT